MDGVPHKLVYFLLDKFDDKLMHIDVGERKIEVNCDAIHQLSGIPNEGTYLQTIPKLDKMTSLGKKWKDRIPVLSLLPKAFHLVKFGYSLYVDLSLRWESPIVDELHHNSLLSFSPQDARSVDDSTSIHHNKVGPKEVFVEKKVLNLIAFGFCLASVIRIFAVNDGDTLEANLAKENVVKRDLEAASDKDEGIQGDADRNDDIDAFV
ncbi:hypothetical protein E3N88_16593 [Mikania micrantha]|uniref:Uncharacterized protein n=1 Tax=Mikania micrantha TaxID=192012 RepID=A0A5N6P0X6_9ASTR|nr:hypothetical protein E3N88_16593 [Mikania micrantha]